MSLRAVLSLMLLTVRVDRRGAGQPLVVQRLGVEDHVQPGVVLEELDGLTQGLILEVERDRLVQLLLDRQRPPGPLGLEWRSSGAVRGPCP